MDNSSGVGVLDKAALVLSALESGPATLAGLVAATGLARPTAHRLAVALEHHRMVARDMQGRFILGPRLSELAAAAGEDRLLATAGPVLTHLRDITGESAQLYRRQGDMRICVAAAERLSGLRDTVPVGSTLTMKAGSSAQILMAWEEPERLHRGLQGGTEDGSEALGGVLVFGDLEVDTDGMEVRRAGEQVALTPTEMRLLLEFSSAPGTVLSRDRLLERVWDYGWGGDTRVVDVHVQRLRTKIGQDRIDTVRGFGYKLRG